MVSGLRAEFDWYLAHQAELLRDYNGKYVAIKNGTVLGAYTTEVEAVNTTARAHELGSFLVQLVSPGSDAYTQVFHSRVAFAR